MTNDPDIQLYPPGLEVPHRTTYLPTVSRHMNIERFPVSRVLSKLVTSPLSQNSVVAAMASTLTNPASTRKIVILGAGFLGTHIARALARNPANRIQLTSRNPKRLQDKLLSPSETNHPTLSPSSFLPPHAADITDKSSLVHAFRDASAIISLVGVLTGNRDTFETVQWRGVQNIIQAVQEVNAAKTDPGAPIVKIVHVSAIGADLDSPIDYFRTKALAEKELFEAFGKEGPSVTILRPSLVFGEGDGFFKRFATLSKYIPFLPVFGGGNSLFQPVFVGDIARAVEILCRTDDQQRLQLTRNNVIQAGGPDIFTYRQLMELILKHSNRSRPIVSLPFFVGKMQGMVLERLPENILTVTQSQIEQLKLDSVVSDRMRSLHGERYSTLAQFIADFGGREDRLARLDEVLPTYL